MEAPESALWQNHHRHAHAHRLGITGDFPTLLRTVAKVPVGDSDAHPHCNCPCCGDKRRGLGGRVAGRTGAFRQAMTVDITELCAPVPTQLAISRWYAEQ